MRGRVDDEALVELAHRDAESREGEGLGVMVAGWKEQCAAVLLIYARQRVSPGSATTTTPG